MSESRTGTPARRARLVVISAPSGSGKTTIARAILKRFPQMLFSVSATTRRRRPVEREGKDYFFLSRQDFEAKVKAGLLVEWENIYGDLYGTLKSEVERAIASGRDMLFDIDVKGALSIKRAYPREAVLIFVEPPSADAIKSRLTKRRTETEEALRRRLERVPMELAEGPKFDFKVLNDDLDKAIQEVIGFVEAETGIAAKPS
jgi:guanylate kinase